MRKLVALSAFVLGGVAIGNAAEPVVGPETMLQKLETEDIELEKEIMVLRSRLDVLEQKLINNKKKKLEYNATWEWKKNVRKHYLQDLKDRQHSLQDLKKANEGLEKNHSAEFRTVPY